MHEALLFVENDPTETGLYVYRSPHFAAARRRGMKCITALPPGVATKPEVYTESDEVIGLDSLSARAIVEACHRYSERYAITAIMCHAGHPSPRGMAGVEVAEASRQLGLRHCPPRAVELANNKFLCRQVLDQAGLPNGPFAYASTMDEVVAGADRVGFPLFIKPAIGAGCAHVKKCDTLDALRQHYATFVKNFGLRGDQREWCGHPHNFIDMHGETHSYVPGKSVILEGYIDGPEGSAECIVIGKRAVAAVIHDKILITERKNTIVEDLLITPPARFSPSESAAIRKFSEQAIEALGLQDCIVHLEFRLGPDRIPRSIEVNPRIGGLYVDAAFQDLIGLDPFDAYLALLRGSEYPDAHAVSQIADAVLSASIYHTMFCIYPQKSGLFKSITGVEEAGANIGILRHKLRYQPGVYFNADEEEVFLLRFWGKADTPDEILNLYSSTVAMVHVEIQ